MPRRSQVNNIRPNSLLSMLDATEDAVLFDELRDFSADRHQILQRAGKPTQFVYFPFRE